MSESLQHGVSIETKLQHEDFLKKNEYKYRKFFKDYESYEVFMMLPVAEADRMRFLHKLLDEERHRLSDPHYTTTPESDFLSDTMTQPKSDTAP